eukprot:1186065-Prorocentrum_minimum.AAC.3
METDQYDSVPPSLLETPIVRAWERKIGGRCVIWYASRWSGKTVYWGTPPALFFVTTATSPKGIPGPAYRSMVRNQYYTSTVPALYQHCTSKVLT